MATFGSAVYRAVFLFSVLMAMQVAAAPIADNQAGSWLVHSSVYNAHGSILDAATMEDPKPDFTLTRLEALVFMVN